MDLNKLSCSCSEFFDKGVCGHLIRGALMIQVALPGLAALQNFATKSRRKNRAQQNSEDESDYESEPEHGNNQVEQNYSEEQDLVQQAETGLENNEVVDGLSDLVPTPFVQPKRGRGRPRKPQPDESSGPGTSTQKSAKKKTGPKPKEAPKIGTPQTPKNTRLRLRVLNISNNPLSNT